jgi:hypothetical protein
MTAASQATLVAAITCPHCGQRFPPEDLLFVARSPGLNFDHRLPEGQMRRFRPSHFTFQGDAIDPKGAVCSETACPACHLNVPRILAMRESIPLSIFGSPSSGKSYLLGAMTQMLRVNAGSSGLRFDDVDTEANQIILDYERRMFHQPTPDHWVFLEKTGEVGDWYSDVWFGPRRDPKSGAELARNKKALPKPFLFRIDPTDGHPAADREGMARVVCLYDNAGEHFQGGGDRWNNVTGHLRDSQGLIFVFDPTQDQKFRAACRERSGDRQFQDVKVDTQDILYGNVMNRILALRTLLPTDRLRVPMVVALTKFDAWKFLLNTQTLPSPYREVPLGTPDGRCIRAYDARVTQAVSKACRDLLQSIAPHILSTIEARCDPAGILYLPVSATGGPAAGKTAAARWPFAPEPPPQDGYDYFLQRDIRPLWAEVPMLALLHRCAPMLVPTIQRKVESQPVAT